MNIINMMILISIIGLAVLYYKLNISYKLAERLKERREIINTSMTLVIPVYNEELNIDNCLLDVLTSIKPCKEFAVIVIDDGSIDNTLKKANNWKEFALKEGIDLKVINAGERPNNLMWIGKNWACYKAMQVINSNWVLFIDADIRLKKEAIRNALNEAVLEKVDLLSVAPRLKCDCLSEWAIQPIMALLITIGFPIKNINSKESNIAFAAGPFMLFKTISYINIGGHKKVANEVVEDIELAKLVKRAGYKLKFLLGLDQLELRMYRNFSLLWEGWTKNWFIALDSSLLKTIIVSFIIFILFTYPWILLISNIILVVVEGAELPNLITGTLMALVAILQQFLIRLNAARDIKIPNKYFYLTAIGGIVISMLGPVSSFKVLTGKNWTWKGRKLSKMKCK